MKLYCKCSDLEVKGFSYFFSFRGNMKKGKGKWTNKKNSRYRATFSFNFHLVHIEVKIFNFFKTVFLKVFLYSTVIQYNSFLEKRWNVWIEKTPLISLHRVKISSPKSAVSTSSISTNGPTSATSSDTVWKG